MEQAIVIEKQIQAKVADSISDHRAKIAEERAKGAAADPDLIRKHEADIEDLQSPEGQEALRDLLRRTWPTKGVI